MADCREATDKEIVDLVRNKLYCIINAHVMDGDDECAEEHLKFFMAGFCWCSDINCTFSENGEVFLSLPYRVLTTVFTRTYYLLNINEELKTLRKSINRHYHKNGGKFYERN